MSTEAKAAAVAALEAQGSLRTGPMLLAFFVDAALFGVFLMHFFKWQQWSFPQETVAIRCLVYWMLIHSIGYSVYMIANNMRVFAYHYGDWSIFLDKTYVQWTFLVESVLRTPVSVFFTSRAYKLAGRPKLLPIVLTPLFLASISGAIWARISQAILFTSPLGMAPVYLWMGSEVVGDAIITCYIMYYLVKSRTGWKQTDKTITKLVILAIETQLVPTMCALTYLLIIVINSKTPIGRFFAFLPRVYAISGIYVLNKRYTLRREMDHETAAENYGVRSRRMPHGNIQVITETIRHVDELPMHDIGPKGTDTSSNKEDYHTLDYNTSETRLTQESRDVHL